MKKIKSIFLVLLCFFMMGCSINRYNDSLVFSECRKLEHLKQTYEYNFSTGKNAGTLIIASQPASWQLAVKNYQFYINEHHITAYKYSDTTISLDSGEYIVKGKVNFFGFSASKKVKIEPGKKTAVIFRGPVAMTTKGIFWDVQ